MRILMLGNSLTFANDTPQTLATLIQVRWVTQCCRR